ncbi:MAG: hypothetical protein NTY09_04770, partial [bacterium]|nr:hypothetical protein [bacterium]
VDAELKDDGSLEIITENVSRFAIDFSDNPDLQVPRNIIVDNQVVDTSSWEYPEVMQLAITDSGWIPCIYDVPKFGKSILSMGPIKRAYYQPFFIIAGQSGTLEQNELNMEIARDLANRWWYRANGLTQVFTDINILEPGKNLSNNLILIGGPDSNLLSAQFADSFPIRMEDDGIWLGDQWIEGGNLACQFVYPRPNFQEGSLVHCIWGNSLEGMRLSGGLTCLYSGSNLPDFLIYDDDVRMMGYAGVKAAGFFDNQWGLNPDYYYLRR